MNKHTPEPWTKDHYYQVVGKNGRVIHVEDFTLSSCSSEEEDAGENTKRIVLCVNACEGFSNEDLEGTNLFDDYLKSLREIVTLAKQRDRLLAELKATESRLHEVSTFCATVEQQRDELLSILQRLKAVDFGEHWNSDAEQAAIAARALITKFEVENVL